MKKTKGNPFAFRRLTGLPLLLAVLALTPPGCRAQEAAAVLAKGSGIYFETFLSFQKALGRPLSTFDLSAEKPRLPRGLKAAVAFGSKAADYNYPSGVKVIYLLSPGYAPAGPGAGSTGISALPEPSQAIEAYIKIQPGLRRLGVFTVKHEKNPYLSELAAAAKPRGVEIISIELNSPGEFPSRLRDLAGKVDAFWLLPEPTLISKISLMVLAEFSCSNKLPYYAPSGGLTELGAAASFAPNFAEAGVAAAAALEKALSGQALPGTIYIPRSELTVNAAFIKKCGLPVIVPAPPGNGR
jgi:hypothetical protein